jgi:hypothetical protein
MPSVSFVVGRRHKRGTEIFEAPIDLASRIGAPGPTRTEAPAPETVRRVDGPIESDRAARGRPAMIGANEPPSIGSVEVREPERPAAVPALQSMMIGVDEAVARALPIGPSAVAHSALPGTAIASTREAPSAGEMDLVVMPLPTPDEWHHFELALRRLPGVGPLRIEYYRAGILKLRLRWSGAQRFAAALADVPGYRVGVLGEDRSTVQIRVVRS